MNKIFKFLALIVLIQSCTYEPVYLNKNYNFKFAKISTEGDGRNNNSIKNFLKITQMEIRVIIYISKALKEKK